MTNETFSLFSIKIGSVISVHEHELREGVDQEEYERVLEQALKDLHDIPGLQTVFVLKSFKGSRARKWAVIWIWENKKAIIKNFGTTDAPIMPPAWIAYENTIAPFLDRHPDTITFSAYELLFQRYFDDNSTASICS